MQMHNFNSCHCWAAAAAAKLHAATRDEGISACVQCSLSPPTPDPEPSDTQRSPLNDILRNTTPTGRHISVVISCGKSNQ